MKLHFVVAAAALGCVLSGYAATTAHAQNYWRPFYSDSYVRYRCDRDGDRCAYYRCDADGDRCDRVSAYYTREGGETSSTVATATATAALTIAAIATVTAVVRSASPVPTSPLRA